MVFLIQNSQNRGRRCDAGEARRDNPCARQAREQFIGIEHLTDKQVEKIRADLEEEVGDDSGKAGTADESIRCLLDR